MNARAKTAERFFCAVAVAGLLVNLTVPTVGLRLANADDDALARGLTDPATALANRMHDFQVGRFYADARFWCDEELLRLSSDAVHGAVRVGLFFVAMLAAAWFAWEWRRSERAAWLVLIFGIGFLPVTVGYQVLLSAPTLWLGWAGVWAMGALALRPESAATRCGMTAAFAVALGAHEVNAVFVVWPAMLSWFARGREGVPAIRRETILCGAVLVVYGALSLWLRHAARAATTSEVYEGVKLSLDFREAFIALNLYTWSGLPGLDSWLARTSEVNGALWLSPLEWLHRAREWATGGSVAAATLLGAAVWQGTRSDEREADRAPMRGAGIFVALFFAAFAPNLLLALTAKYQIWAHQRMWPYYYTSMSYLVWVVLLAGGAMGLLAAIRSNGMRIASRVGLAAAVAVVAIGVGAANHEAAALLRRHTFFHIQEYRQWFPPP